MKNIALLLICINAFLACSKKTVPAKNIGLAKETAANPSSDNTTANTVAGSREACGEEEQRKFRDEFRHVEDAGGKIECK